MEPTRQGCGASRGTRTPRRIHPRAELRALQSELATRGVAATPAAVAVALWSHADAEGRCWPSQLRLARSVRRCERTVRTAVQDLEARGIIARDVPTLRERAHARRTTAYRFTLAGRLEVPRPVEAQPHELPPTAPPADALGDRTAPAPVEASPELPPEVEHQAPPDDGPELHLGAPVLVDLDAAEVAPEDRPAHRQRPTTAHRQPLPSKRPREKFSPVPLSALGIARTPQGNHQKPPQAPPSRRPLVPPHPSPSERPPGPVACDRPAGPFDAVLARMLARSRTG